MTVQLSRSCHVQPISEPLQVTERCHAPTCVMYLPCAGFVLRKVISIFLETANIRSLKLLTTANLRFYICLLHVLKIEKITVR